jgi:diaminopimelate decarboxylase
MYNYDFKNGALYIGNIAADDLIKQFGSPLYVYDEEIIKNRVESLINAIPYSPLRIHYAVKANTNLHILKIFNSEGCYVDTVSPSEIEISLKAGFEPSKILFTGVNLTENDMGFAMERGVMLNIGSLFTLEQYAKNHPNTEISIRVNPDMGAGHHSHVITGGRDSKFGIFESDFSRASDIIKKYNLKLAGIHCHIGSGILEEKKFMEVMEIILRMARNFDDIDFVDFGGGVGVAYRPEQPDFDLKLFGNEASRLMENFSREYGKKVALSLEPGRFLVAEAGFLLTSVTDKKHTPKFTFVGVNSGFNHLIRPMAYGSYHHIVNASRADGKLEDVVVAGYICESGDVFTRDKEQPVARPVAEPQVGDTLAILTAGAYGYAMASQYNSRPRPAEVLVGNGKARLIRRAETIDDILSTTP